MNLFAWLCLGHLIGDWMLQNDWMARGKRQGVWRVPLLVHCGLYTAAVMTAAAAAQGPISGATWVWLGLVAFGSHWLIDGCDLAGWWLRRFRQTDLASVRTMNDQTLHLAALAYMAALAAGG